MSGHSKWSTIKRKKGAADAKRGAIFTRLSKEIALAAREGGGDPDSNFRLRLAIDRAKSANMPKDNIERAIKRGTGENKDAAAFEEIMYEGYAPHGVALMIETVTDNRNRAVADIRHALTRYGGSMGETGSVAWQFTRAAYFAFSSAGLDEDEIFMHAVEGGADDVTFDQGTAEIVGPVESFKTIGDQLRLAGIEIDEAGLQMLPTQEIELGVDETLKVMKLIEALENLDDVQNVYSNLKISDEALAVLGSE
ncbi:MAG TPA: YebC/PmpR family DNA-binding transcriptional regulator [Anaerolineales bacterium]|nr:YebC/PmpR family DNA-binding transcriptional regulator [Anaerolineales bacterium]